MGDNCSYSRANAQANLTSSLQNPEFYEKNLKFKEQIPEVIELKLYNIKQQYNADIIRQSLSKENIQVVKIDLQYNPITGEHDGKAKLTMRLKKSNINTAYGILYN